MNDNDLMKIFYLETPSLERKNEIIDYINEFVEYKSDINGCFKCSSKRIIRRIRVKVGER